MLNTFQTQRSLNGPLYPSQCLRLTTVPAKPVLNWLANLCNQAIATGRVPSIALALQPLCPDLPFAITIRKPSDRLLTYGLEHSCCQTGLPISHFGVEISRGTIHPTALNTIDAMGSHLASTLSLRQGPPRKPSQLPWHLNAYAQDPLTGQDILMTSDHIYPKALGGPDHWANRQPMLSGVNNLKGTSMSPSDHTKWNARKLAHPFLMLVTPS